MLDVCRHFIITPDTSFLTLRRSLMKRLMTILMFAGILGLLVTTASANKPIEKPDAWTRGLLDCSNAIPLYCNSTVNGDNTGMPNNVVTYSCSSWNEAGGEVVYELTLDQYYDLTATLSGMSCDLDIFLLASCDEAACLAYGNSAVTGEFGPGTFYVVVDGYSGAECAYTLDVTCAEVPPPPEEDGSKCNFTGVCIDWDFAQGDQGFTPAPCGASGAAVWQYGAEMMVPGAPGNVWGTILNGNYLSSAGEGLLSPPFTVTPDCNWMEIKHYVYTEGYITSSGNIYDGGNVTVDEIVIPPLEGRRLQLRHQRLRAQRGSVRRGRVRRRAHPDLGQGLLRPLPVHGHDDPGAIRFRLGQQRRPAGLVSRVREDRYDRDADPRQPVDLGRFEDAVPVVWNGLFLDVWGPGFPGPFPRHIIAVASSSSTSWP
jgi:hypothetical protein